MGGKPTRIPTTLATMLSLNAICRGNTAIAQQQNLLPNSMSAASSEQVTRLRLDVSGERNEWIRITSRKLATSEFVLTAYHTKQVRQNFISNAASRFVDFGLERLAGEIIDGYDGPVPSLRLNFYRWQIIKRARLRLFLENIPAMQCG